MNRHAQARIANFQPECKLFGDLSAPSHRVYHKCILPTMLKDASASSSTPFRRCAWPSGSRALKERDSAEMRAELIAYLGSRTTCFRYRMGEKLLNPRQQQWIRDLFRHYGYTAEVVFDGSREVYIFD